MLHFYPFFHFLSHHIPFLTTLGTVVYAFKIAIFTLDHRQFEKKAVNCNLIGPDAGVGIILSGVRVCGSSVVEDYVEVVVPYFAFGMRVSMYTCHVHTVATVYTHVELKMVYCTSIYSTSNFTRTLIQLYIFVHT